MTQKAKSRNADFIRIAAERQSATLSAAGAVAPLSEANTTLLHNPRGEAPSTTPYDPTIPLSYYPTSSLAH